MQRAAGVRLQGLGAAASVTRGAVMAGLDCLLVLVAVASGDEDGAGALLIERGGATGIEQKGGSGEGCSMRRER